mgnify:CR=1 FL=1
MIELIIFSILAIVIAVFAVLAVTSKQIIRSAIYLLFVLLATAGLFLMLNYHFLFAVQITVYAGGIMVLFIMAIFLTHRPGQSEGRKTSWKIKSSFLLSVSGLILCGYIVVQNVSRAYHYVRGLELNMQDIGHAMMGTGKYQFLLPFEAISLLLLACIIGAIMIARKEKNVESSDNKDLDK